MFDIAVRHSDSALIVSNHFRFLSETNPQGINTQLMSGFEGFWPLHNHACATAAPASRFPMKQGLDISVSDQLAWSLLFELCNETFLYRVIVASSRLFDRYILLRLLRSVYSFACDV